MIAVQLCPCRIPWRDRDGTCLICGKAQAQPDVLDIPSRDTMRKAREYRGKWRNRKRGKGR